jgi:hypothetical protein
LDSECGPELLGTIVGLEIEDGVAGPALFAGSVGLGGVFEQAPTASARRKIEPIRAIRPVRTLAPPNRHYRGRTETPRLQLLL